MPLVHLKTKRLEYKFDLLGKYTIIKGDSGIGKTTFYDLVESLNMSTSPVQNLTGLRLVRVPRDMENFPFEDYEECILVLDEDCLVLHSKAAMSKFKNSKNYFIIFTRKINLAFLPIGVDSVFKMKTSGKFHTLEKYYPRFHSDIKKLPEIIITEDIKSSYLFMKDFLSVYNNKDIIIEPAYGSNIERVLCKEASASKITKSVQYWIENGKTQILVCYDASAFASYIEPFIAVLERYPNVNIMVVDWDSFESYILSSPMFEMPCFLQDTTFNFESLEQYCTYKLIEMLPQYNKSTLCLCLLRKRCSNTCKNKANCDKKKKSYETLIYDQIQQLQSRLENTNERKKEDKK